MKPLPEISLTESTNYWTGRLIIAIGTGQFRDEIVQMQIAIAKEAYERGVKDTKDKK